MRPNPAVFIHIAIPIQLNGIICRIKVSGILPFLYQGLLRVLHLILFDNLFHLLFHTTCICLSGIELV